MTYHLNVRLPDHTEKQIKELSERTGMTVTQLVIVVFDRLYHTEEEKKQKKEQDNVYLHD